MEQRTLTDADVEAVATRMIQLLGSKLSAPEKRPESPALVPPPPKMPEPKLAYTLKELAAELGVSKVTIYRSFNYPQFGRQLKHPRQYP